MTPMRSTTTPPLPEVDLNRTVAVCRASGSFLSFRKMRINFGAATFSVFLDAESAALSSASSNDEKDSKRGAATESYAYGEE